ncbi:MAG: NOP5/NOP56 family protein [Thermoproteota archaeon]
MEKPLNLVETPVGLIVFEDNAFETYRFRSVGESVEYYQGNPSTRASSFLRKWRGKIIRVERRSILGFLVSLGLKPVVEEPLARAAELRSDISRLLSILSLSREDYVSFARSVSTSLAKESVEESAKRRDLDIILAMQAYDDLVKMSNMLQDRIVTWAREREPVLMEHGDAEKAIKMMVAEGHGPIYVRKMAELYLKMVESRSSVEEQISMLMEESAPNLSSIVGPLLGARLIARVGSLSRLASLPASTIQIIGAEKALFRAMRRRGKPPKHGVIFQHPWVHGSPRKTRGKIARLLASRIAVAARIDCFSGRYIGEELKKDLEDRVKALREARASG